MTDTQMVIDPVCGMGIDPANATSSTEHAGQTYYFCSQSCAQTFAANPGAHTAAASTA